MYAGTNGYRYNVPHITVVTVTLFPLLVVHINNHWLLYVTVQPPSPQPMLISVNERKRRAAAGNHRAQIPPHQVHDSNTSASNFNTTA